MPFLKSLRWSVALLGLVGVLAALLVSAQGHWSQSRMNDAAVGAFVAKDVVADILPPPMYLIEARLVLSQAVEGSMPAPQAAKELQRLRDEYNARVDHWSRNPPFGLEKQLLGRQHRAAGQFLAAAQAQVIARLQAGDVAGARQALPAVHQLYLEHRAGVDETVAAGNAFAERSTAAFDAARQQTTTVAWVATAAAVVLVLLLERLVLASIERPLMLCVDWARRIAAGDLAEPPAGQDQRQDAIGMLEASLCDMRHQLAHTVGEVRRNAEAVATASAQIAASNQDMSQRTEKQAGVLQQTTSTVAGLSDTVRHNADHSRQANAMAQQASEVAERGGAVVTQAVQTMKAIDDSSRQISDIITVIDGIAFQTNILALNAAVEAARAGEQGRGFAVVAGEVRMLAQRSAEAAKQIEGLIKASVQRVESGATLVNQAGDTMHEVVAAIRRVTDIMSEIDHASDEQRSGMVQIAETMGHMDQSTQQATAMVEELAAAAEGLSSQADRLVDAVAVFRLDDEAAPVPA